jgi:histidine transporter
MQAVSSCIGYWLPNVPRWVWGIATWLWSFSINCLPVKVFSWVQSTLSSGEVIVVCGLTLSLILCVFGVIGNAVTPSDAEGTQASHQGLI